MLQLRKKEPWMVKGNRVQVGAVKGKITQVTSCNVGGVVHAMRLYVQNDGVGKAWPVSPFAVELEGKRVA